MSNVALCPENRIKHVQDNNVRIDITVKCVRVTIVTIEEK